MSCLQLLLPERWCKVCHSKDNLSKCGACKCILYCCRDHQIQHRREHKDACNGVVAARTKLEKEKAQLAALPPHNIFDDPESVGHFWQIFETRPYMKQLLETAMATVQVPTPISIEAALGYLMEALRLCNSDNLGVRSRIPNFLLRLGRDQECYDFIKYWRGNFMGRTEESFLDMKDENIFEDVEYFRGEWPDVSHYAALTLIKIRILINLESLDHLKGEFAKAGPRMTNRAAKLKELEDFAISPWVLKRRDIMDQEDLKPSMDEIKGQIKESYNILHQGNKHFWQMMLKPTPQLGTPVSMYTAGDFEEAKMAWQFSYASWAETPNAMEAIQLLHAGKWPPKEPLS